MEVLLAGIGSKTLADMAAKGWITRSTDKWGRRLCQITPAGQEAHKAARGAPQSSL
jgi:DNA-binding MarR family transcriptional regulator